MPTNANALRVQGAVSNNFKLRNYTTSHDPLTEITSRLNGVLKRHNGGYLAFCPSHDDKRGRSLAIGTGRQGQVLLKCFAGCSIHEITSAIGLNPSDLFIKLDQYTYDKQSRSSFLEWQLLSALRYDALVVLIATKRLLAGEQSTEEDIEFLSKAVIRIDEVVSYSVRGAQWKRN